MAGTAVVAFGGNALVPAGTRGTEREQRERAAGASRPLADLVAEGWRLLLVHGNGPQVGHLLIQQEASEDQVPPLSLALCVAATQGTLGHVLEDALRAEMSRRSLGEDVTALLTTVVVQAEDPAFSNPTKPVGPTMTEQRARHIRMVQGIPMTATEKGYRRIVASPRPTELLPAGAARHMLRRYRVVAAGGGGGVPVVRAADGTLRPVDAVVDKDLTALLLAREVRASVLVFLTEVPYIYLDWGEESQRPLERVTASELAAWHRQGHFPAGSMGPKVEAALEFLEGGGEQVVVTDLAHIEGAVAGERGTHVVPG